MTKDPLDGVGFHQARRARPLTRRKLAFAELIATAALAVSIVVAATAVSIGIARADALLPLAAGDDGTLALALLLALMIAAMGGFAALVTRGQSRQD